MCDVSMSKISRYSAVGSAPALGEYDQPDNLT